MLYYNIIRNYTKIQFLPSVHPAHFATVLLLFHLPLVDYIITVIESACLVYIPSKIYTQTYACDISQ